jgi:N-acetylmuramoyl-L-alanine amidase
MNYRHNPYHTMSLTPCAWILFVRRKKVEYLYATVTFLLLMLMTQPAFPAQPAGIKTESVNITAEQRYQEALAFAERLDQEEALGKVRDNWLNCAQTFHAIHTSERKGPFGPTGLFMVGKTYRSAFNRFKMPQDLDAALQSFLALEDLYPHHALAPDALYEAAECAGMMPGKEALANDLYRKIVNSYPQTDQAGKAAAKIRPHQTTQTSAAQTPPRLASLAPVKYWSSDDYCRIVIQLDEPVPFSAKPLPRNNSQDHRLAIDLSHSYADQTTRQPLLMQTGLLRAIRPDQANEDTSRIVLELASFSGYKIFSLPDPFRVIVDIRGSGTPKDEPSAGETALVPAVAQIVQTAKRPAHATPQTTQSSVVSLVEQKKHSPGSAEKSLSGKGKPRIKLSLAQQLGLGVRTIVIDPGHGGKDPGAMAFGLKEKDITLAIAKKIAQILGEKYQYQVVLTRTKDVFIPLEERTAIANTRKGDLFISIHTNAHTDKGKSGIEVYFLNFATDAHAMRVAALENATSTRSIGEMQDILSTMMQNSKTVESSRLAQFVQSNLISGLARRYKPRNLGVKQAPFYVLIGAEMPAILAEVSFITNPEEAKLLQNEQYTDQLALHFATGIVAYVDHHHASAVAW